MEIGEWIISLGSALIGAIVGGLATFMVEKRVRKQDEKERIAHYATLLYYDLKSIVNYVENDRSPVNLRYSPKWQDVVANCSFLSSDQVGVLYDVYDGVYNFNYAFGKSNSSGLLRRKDDYLKDSRVKSHLENKIFNEIMGSLKRHLA